MKAAVFHVFVTALPAAAQAPAPPTAAFDGTYAGVSGVSTRSEPGSENRYCREPGVPSPLTIRNGVIQSTGGDDRWQGTVDWQVGAGRRRTPLPYISMEGPFNGVGIGAGG